MVEFRDDLLTNSNLVVNCRTEEQVYNLKQWFDNKKPWKASWSLQYWDSSRDYSGYNMVSYEEYSKVTGKTILTYEEALKPVDIEPKNITAELETKEVKYAGTVISNYDTDTGIEQIIKIPMEANLEEMAHMFCNFLKSVGYSPISGVTIHRENMEDVSSEDLYC